MGRRIATSLLVTVALAGCTARPAQVSTTFSRSETSLDFGAVAVGARSQQSFDFSFRGVEPVALSVDPATVPEGFRVDLGTASLAPGADELVTVAFAPTHPGDFGGTIVLRGGSASMHVQVAGQGFVLVVETKPIVVDFGSVHVGTTAALSLSLTNPSTHAENIYLSADQGFVVDRDLRELDAGATTTLEVTFAPKTRGFVQGSLSLAPCGGCEGETRVLLGRGVIEDFTFTPSPLDFGNTPLGSTTCEEVVIDNTGDLPVRFSSATPDPTFTQAGVFELRVGNLLDGVTSIAPGASAPITICFAPKAPGGSYNGMVGFATVGRQFRSLLVHGIGGVPLLTTAPVDLDIGATTAGLPLSLSVSLEDGGAPGTLILGRVRLETSDPALTLQFPDGDPAGRDVGNSPVGLQVTLQGEVGGHTANLVAEVRGGDPVVFPVRGYVVEGEPCKLSVPAELDLGLVPLQATSVRKLHLRNPGAGRCYVWGMEVEEESSNTFALQGPPSEPVAIEPGATLDLNVAYSPKVTSITPDEAVLYIRQLGSPTPISVRLTGFATQLDMSVTPDPIDFGPVPVGFQMQRPIALINNNPRLVKVGGNVPPGNPAGDVAMSADSPPAFVVSGVPERLPYTISGGGAMHFVVTFTPTLPGHYEGLLAIWLKDATSPILVPVTADAVTPPENKGLLVETTLDSPDDVDLHLIDLAGGDPSLNLGWYDPIYDCHSGNEYPNWDTSSRADDPYLYYGVVSGRTEEAIAIAAPSTDQGYAVGVHRFTNRSRVETKTATTRISCNGRQVAEVQTVLQRLYQAVVVGTVTWSSDGTCNFEPSGLTLTVIP